ncbi:aminodeoxychorismate synthase component I [Calditerrivibrio nitroreducens]|uniref:Chorismate binding protein n=1 Tax=Calditerrivibrio nitroreducens (strain DSM 19672 / NBRC 101217 / Yu37-1) TaxID=768670 RepID=E4TH31_CALNY|nr:aminodeoxychorismate synthase component I [Calditerrivibrio nitroreducens]ADR19829.1 Chorismate binding protein [Calditerrivibrio nitroreducens DSM 19672]
MFLSKDRFIDLFDTFYKNLTPFIFLVDFDVQNLFIAPLSSLEDKDGILFDFRGYTNSKGAVNDSTIYLKKEPVSLDSYRKSFDLVQKHLSDGDSYLLNLTFPTKIETDVSFGEIFQRSKALYKMKFYDEFVFFSPEQFVCIKDGKISTHPMKGTKVKVSESSEYELLNDEKELAEHITIVDLMRNDLSMVAKNVKVERFRYLSYIKSYGKTIIQTSSEISGDLTDGSVAEKLLNLLPAGSISGAPKRKTVEIIKKAELDNRGFYTGIAGVFDGLQIDSCVIIRYIEKKGDSLFYRSGGGITVYSKVEDEYREMIDKIYVPCI